MPPQDDIDDLKERQICCDCIRESYLSDEVHKQGKRRKCFYCGNLGKCYSIEEMSERIETAFEDHYARTSTEPDALQWLMISDKESDYDWSRKGQETEYAIMDAAQIPEEAASDIQKALEEKYYDFDSAAMGEETEFDSDARYEEKGVHDGIWQAEWRGFEHSLKTEARFFSQSAARHLTSVFEGIDRMTTRDGRSLIASVGPETNLTALYRARVFQSDTKVEGAIAQPDKQLGPPPPASALAGRMNARGISVFYGANDPMVALAEVRPPVGSRVAVARFKILRSLRLLNLTALSDVFQNGSIFDSNYKHRLERTMFLRSLSSRLVRPVMPDDEPLEYLVTQAIADFLATEGKPPLDGIIFPSVQAAGNALNVVLFHKASYVERIELPLGSKVTAASGDWDDDGWSYYFRVTEYVSSQQEKPKDKAPDLIFRRVGDLDLSWEDMEPPGAAPALRVDLENIHIHIVRAVQFETEQHKVYRSRSVMSDPNEEQNPDF